MSSDSRSVAGSVSVSRSGPVHRTIVSQNPGRPNRRALGRAESDLVEPDNADPRPSLDGKHLPRQPFRRMGKLPTLESTGSSSDPCRCTLVRLPRTSNAMTLPRRVRTSAPRQPAWNRPTTAVQVRRLGYTNRPAGKLAQQQRLCCTGRRDSRFRNFASFPTSTC
jgi:hypothetical protein